MECAENERVRRDTGLFLYNRKLFELSDFSRSLHVASINIEDFELKHCSSLFRVEE